MKNKFDKKLEKVFNVYRAKAQGGNMMERIYTTFEFGGESIEVSGLVYNESIVEEIEFDEACYTNHISSEVLIELAEEALISKKYEGELEL